jgi:hypothetical protein
MKRGNMAEYPYEQIRKLQEYEPEIIKNYMTNEEMADYIRNKNLDIQTVEQIVSFFNDYDIRYTGQMNWWDKKEIVRFVHKEKFSEIWKLVTEELTKGKK